MNLVASCRVDRDEEDEMSERVRKAVFPAGGLGTRFLPATKVIPKEMLALVDKPIIQYGVEEAVASGIEHIIIVTSRGKGAMEDHFDISYELDAILERKGNEPDGSLERKRKRSEEHTSELQSLRHLVCRLLL